MTVKERLQLQSGQLRKPLATLGMLWLLIVGVTGIAWLGPASLQRDAVVMLVNLVIVVGLFVFIGNTGIFSFGQLAFMGIGGYAAGILVMEGSQKQLLYPEMFAALQSVHAGPIPGAIIGAGIAALVAALLCPPLMRLQGLNAALATFAVLIIIFVVANNLEGVTNGSPGLANVPTVGIGFVLPGALIAVTFAWAFQQTLVSRRTRAVRDDEAAARSIGIRPAFVRSAAFILSAFIVGLGGTFYVQTQGAFEPTAFYLNATLIAMAMLIVGGRSSLSGAVVGVLVLSTLSRILGDLEAGVNLGAISLQVPPGVRDVGLALTMLVILVTRPDGLMAGRELSLPRVLPRRTPGLPTESHDNERAM